MNAKEHIEFNNQWSITYGEQNIKIEELQKKIYSIKENDLLSYPINFIRSIYYKIN